MKHKCQTCEEKKDLQDMNLISARKAALGWKEDADFYRESRAELYEAYIESLKRHPIFYLAGVLSGVLGCLIAAQII